MNPYYELPTLASRFRQVPVDWHRQPEWPGRPAQSGRQIDDILSIAILRLVQGVETLVRRGAGWITRRHRRRTAIRELQSLSDRLLQDIGLERGQITETVDHLLETGEQP
jgi:uncharacterized protein YjiS (DUF1127 family)